jgi:hypothetical protein
LYERPWIREEEVPLGDGLRKWRIGEASEVRQHNASEETRIVKTDFDFSIVLKAILLEALDFSKQCVGKRCTIRASVNLR